MIPAQTRMANKKKTVTASREFMLNVKCTITNICYLEDLRGLVGALIYIPAEGPARPASQGPQVRAQLASQPACKPASQPGSIRTFFAGSLSDYRGFSGGKTNYFCETVTKNKNFYGGKKVRLRGGPGGLKLYKIISKCVSYLRFLFF